jgi:hypothetical protein
MHNLLDRETQDVRLKRLSCFADRELDSIKPDEVCQFLKNITVTLAKSTRRLQYA